MEFRGTESTWPVILPLLPKGGGTVLDAGSGEHTWSSPGWEVHRCDSGQHYADGRRLSGVDVVDLNGMWPYSDRQFTGIIAADVVEHLESMWHFFREAFRVASSFVVISTPNVESMMSRTMFKRSGWLWGFFPQEIEKSGHLTPIFRWQLEKVCQRSGWTMDVVTVAHRPVPQKTLRRYGIQEFSSVRRNNRTLVVRFVPGGRHG